MKETAGAEGGYVVANPRHRARVVKGWAFMDLTDDEVTGVKAFLASGVTDSLPESFRRRDYTIYETRS